MTPGRAAALLWVVWFLSWLGAAFWRAPAAKRPLLRREIVYRVLVMAGAVLLFGRFRGDRWVTQPLWHRRAAAGWLLVVIVGAGLAFTWWARIHLGRFWSSSVTRKADHRIVDTGPYALVRHPIYTGVILATIATAALRGTPLAWIAIVIMTIGWVVKARVEESFLREELGRDAYDAYARRVPMLVPGAGRTSR